MGRLGAGGPDRGHRRSTGGTQPQPLDDDNTQHRLLGAGPHDAAGVAGDQLLIGQRGVRGVQFAVCPGSLAPGAHTVDVRASDPSGNVGTATAAFSVDATAPTVPTLGLATLFPGSQVTKAATVSIHLAGTDATSGVGGYELRTRTATLGTALPALGAASSIAASSWEDLSVGHQWCAVGRTVDAAGNTSAWSAEQCLLVPYDDLSLTNSKWTRGTASGTFAGTVSSTSTKGATLTRTGFKGSSVLLVAKVCSTCGRLTITVGGTAKTVSLVSSATAHWAVVPVALGGVRTGTLQIAMTATTGKAFVDAVALELTSAPGGPASGTCASGEEGDQDATGQRTPEAEPKAEVPQEQHQQPRRRERGDDYGGEQEEDDGHRTASLAG